MINMMINMHFLLPITLHGLLPDDPKETTSIRRRSLRFYYDPTLKTLYRRSYDGKVSSELDHNKSGETFA